MNDLIKPLTNQELAILQKEDPEMDISTISEEDISKQKEIVKAVSKENDLAILQEDEQGLDLWLADNDKKRTWNDYIDILERTPITTAIKNYLQNLRPNTRKNYAYYFTDMLCRRIIPETDAAGNIYTVGHFNHNNHEATLQFLKQVPDWSEGTRQLKCAVYISLTSYLSYVSRGWFRKAIASKLNANPTFFQVRDKCATEALSLREWHSFIKILSETNKRDALIARCLLQGAKRISEALSLCLEQIDWEKRIIRFKQSKTGGTHREIPITYPQHFMDDLKKYIAETANIRKDSSVFITRTGAPVTRFHLNISFAAAGKKAGLKSKVHPHKLRATWVTLSKEMYSAQDSEIMRVTGHSSSRMIYMYDKSSNEKNITQELILI